MVPSIRDLDEIKDFVDPAAYAAIKKRMAKSGMQLVQGEAPETLEYSLRLMDSSSIYAHSSASMYSWTARGNGERLLDETTKLALNKDRVRVKMLIDQYIPAMMGKMSYQQAHHGEIWAQRLHRWYTWLESDHAKKFIPKDVRGFLQDRMIDSKGQYTITPMTRAMSGLLYTGALGGNVVSSVKNLFQLVLTTAPTLGPEYLWYGIRNAFSKTGKYFKLRFEKGMEHGKAMRAAYPEFHEAGIAASPIIDDTIGHTLSAAYDNFSVSKLPTGGKLAGISSTMEKVQRALMSVFAASERTVRLVSFEGAYKLGMDDLARSARETGLKFTKAERSREAIKFGRKVVEETQFVAGVPNAPYILVDKGPLTRQFMHFPLRYMEFLFKTGGRIGSAQMPGTKLHNWKTTANAVLWAEGVAHLGMETTDFALGQALMPGALPWAKEYGPGAPIPLIPPAYGAFMAAASDLASGDMTFSESKKAAALLVPGGIALSRALGSLPVYGSDKAARAMMRPYADYKSPTPDGRYPMYSGRGNLMGYMKPSQIFVAALGLPVGSPLVQDERFLYKWLLKNRDRIRGMKREYINAVLRGNMKESRRIDKAFGKAFPEIKSIKMIIDEKDFERAKTLRKITRMEKLLDTLPPEMRPLYAQALETAMMQMSPEFLGLEQGALIEGATAKAREPMRLPTGFHYSQTMGAGGQPTQPESISQAAYGDEGSFSAFAGFQSGQL
jgi:hypothetical protein